MCKSDNYSLCTVDLVLFKQDQSSLWEAALPLIVSSATFVFQAAALLMIKP